VCWWWWRWLFSPFGSRPPSLLLHLIHPFHAKNHSTTFIDGLWAGTNGLTADFATVVYRLQLLGFNAIRLPFSFKEINGAQPRPVARTHCPPVSPRTVAAATAPPGTPPSVLARAPRPGPAFATSPPNTCSAYVPHGRGVTVAHRLAWAADYFVRNGFFVILDYQLNTDASAIEDTGRWVKQWADLATLLTTRYPRTAGRMLLDIMNEPDAAGLAWQPQNGKPGAGDLYLAAMDAIHAVWPGGFVVLVEGCGQHGLARNWGDGLASEEGILSSRRLSDPRPFLSTLVRRPFARQVAFAPHFYPFSISGTTDESTGGGLFWRLSTSAGYLNKAGFCVDGSCHRFPVIIGETGSAFTEPRDLATQLDLIAWATLRGAGNDGRHNRVSGLFIWAWNANAGGGQGLLEGSWVGLDHNKVAFAAAAGAVPWWARGRRRGNGLRPVSVRRTGILDDEDELDAGLAGDGDDEDWAAAAAVVARASAACNNASAAAPAAGSDDGDDGVAVAAPLTSPPLTLRGVAWPGFDGPAARLAGLEGEALGDGIARIRALGFNAVTLPLSLRTVLAPAADGPDVLPACAPPVGADTLADATRPPGPAAAAAVADGWVAFPSAAGDAPAAALAAATAALCDGGESSGLARLAATARALSASGLAVILEDADRSSPTATDPAAWVGGWATVAAAVHAAVAAGGADAAATTPPPFLGVRPLADPDALKLGWGTGLPGLYLAAMDAVAAAAPGAWLLVAGAGMEGLPGAGFPASDPGVASFLADAAARPWGHRLAISPRLHVSSDAGAPDPAALVGPAFGHLASPGLCGGGTAGGGGGVGVSGVPACRRFPIVLGAVTADVADARAAAALGRCIAALAPGCGLPSCSSAEAGTGAAGGPLAGWVWGAWVGGGGGPVAATPVVGAPPPDAAANQQPLAEDTTTAAAASPAPAPPALPPVAWPLVSALTSGLGLAPWFLPPTAHAQRGGWAGPLPAGMEADEADTAVAAAAGPGGSPGLESAAGGGEDVTPPPQQPACRAAVAVAASGPAVAEVKSDGDASSTTASTAGLVVVRLSNAGEPAILPPYRLTVQGTYTSLMAAAGVEGAQVVAADEEDGGEDGATTTLTGLVTAEAAALWPAASNTVSVALAVAGPGDLTPTGVSLNGVACEVEVGVRAEAEAVEEGGGGGSGGPVEVVSVASTRGLH
jgi:hypothetical protein